MHLSFSLFKGQLLCFHTFYFAELYSILDHLSRGDHVGEICILIPYHPVVIGCFQSVEERLVQLLINHWRLILLPS